MMPEFATLRCLSTASVISRNKDSCSEAPALFILSLYAMIISVSIKQFLHITLPVAAMNRIITQLSEITRNSVKIKKPVVL